MKSARSIAILAAIVAASGALAQTPHDASHTGSSATQTASTADHQFASVNIEYKGSKVWVPSTFIVYKGDKVQIHLINETPSGVHGFAIDEFDVKVAVANKEPKTIEFTADKAGLFRVYCHIHPAHIGGQILVLDK